jgi:phytoene dehydrogenase-like protein
MIHLMRNELVKNGVDIRLRTRADKIVIKDGCVSGVVAGGQLIPCRAALSNGNLKKTILELAGEQHFAPEFIEEVKKVRINNSSCQVYMGIRKGEEIENIGDLFFTSTADKFDSDKLMARQPITSRTYSFYYPYTRPGWDRYAIVSSTNALHEDWADLSVDEYQAAKEWLIEDTFKALEKYIPDVRTKVDYVTAATPKTFERYTMHIGGSSFGTKFEGLGPSMYLSEKLPGLYHTGSVAIIMSGWLGAANYGAIVTNNIDQYLYSKEEA